MHEQPVRLPEFNDGLRGNVRRPDDERYQLRQLRDLLRGRAELRER